MKKNIIIRADGGSTIGMGHVVRCLALADMLKNDFEISFAIQEPNDKIKDLINSVTHSIICLPQTTDFLTDADNLVQQLKANDIVVLDGYNFKTEYQQAIKNKGCKLVAIDDLHAWHHVADVVINHADGVSNKEYSIEPYTKLLLGLDYVLLRKEFLNQKKETRKINSVKKMFISMGAADIDNNTKKITEALLFIESIEEIHLMVSTINPHLKDIERLMLMSNKIKTHYNLSAQELVSLLQKCDVAICPASSISLECCAVGIGLISGYTATNQIGNLNGLIKHKTLINFGDINQLSIKEIIQKMERLIPYPSVFNELCLNQKTMIDGKSPERLMEIFKKLTTQQLHFRCANENDVELYFKWTNDVLVRNNSFNLSAVEYDNHVKWFKSKLSSPDCYFYLFLNNENKAVGQVRIDKNKNETVIGISIDENFRGKSLGTEMLRIATHEYFKKYPSSIIVAYIKTENNASYNSFLKAGFSNEEIVIEQGYKSYKLYKKLNS